MTAIKFYYPSNGEDQDALMEHLWDQGTMSYLMFVRRMSLRGNPYIKGVFVLDNDGAMVPSEFDCIPLSKDGLSQLVSEFQEARTLDGEQWSRIRSVVETHKLAYNHLV